MGGAKRYPSIAFRGGAGFRRAQPILRTEGETRWRRLTALPHTSRIAPRDANARLGVIARSEATKQSILSSRGEMDCFAALAMTAQHLNCLCCLKLECRHCEERSDEAIHSFCTRRDGLLRCARNDGSTPELSLLFEIRVPSLRGAKRRSNPCSLCGEMDCFAEPVIGRAFARPVGSQ